MKTEDDVFLPAVVKIVVNYDDHLEDVLDKLTNELRKFHISLEWDGRSEDAKMTYVLKRIENH